MKKAERAHAKLAAELAVQSEELTKALRLVAEQYGNGDRSRIEAAIERCPSSTRVAAELEVQELFEQLAEALESAASSLARARSDDQLRSAGEDGLATTSTTSTAASSSPSDRPALGSAATLTGVESAADAWATRIDGMFRALLDLCAMAEREDLVQRFEAARTRIIAGH